MLKCAYAYMRICVYAYMRICAYAYMPVCVYAYTLRHNPLRPGGRFAMHGACKTGVACKVPATRIRQAAIFT